MSQGRTNERVLSFFQELTPLLYEATNRSGGHLLTQDLQELNHQMAQTF
jgi:hypothetical protein